jgi:hypothetical protein
MGADDRKTRAAGHEPNAQTDFLNPLLTNLEMHTRNHSGQSRETVLDNIHAPLKLTPPIMPIGCWKFHWNPHTHIQIICGSNPHMSPSQLELARTQNMVK